MKKSELISSVIKSIETYLDILAEKGRGEEKYFVRKIENDESSRLIDNNIQIVHTCYIGEKLNIRLDEGARLCLIEKPTENIPIHILNYDKKSGLLSFGCRNSLQAESGNIFIDFKWLVKRCLNWYKENGQKIKDPEEIKINKLLEQINYDVQSDAQIEAIENIFNQKLSYVWGPPGTGKTNFVLTKAVKEIVRAGRKCLVLAPTNIAVDNAMKVIIIDCPESTKIFRYGVPTEAFMSDFPNHCEDHSAKVKIMALENEIQLIENWFKRSSRRNNIISELKDKENEENEHSSSINSHSDSLVLKNNLKVKLSKSIDAINYKFQNIEDEIKLNEKIIEEVDYLDACNKIEILEEEQINIINGIKYAKNELANIGFFMTLFTNKKKYFEEQLFIDQKHLESIEKTLKNKRRTSEKKRETHEKAISELAQLRDKLKGFSVKMAIQNEKLNKLCDDIKSEDKDVRNLELKLEAIRSYIQPLRLELKEIAKNEPLGFDEIDLEVLKIQLIEKKQELNNINIDLSSMSVVGMTLDKFMSASMKNELLFDFIFVDEAPYAPLVKILPLLSVGCQIALLGDHLQLPPICEVENNELIDTFWRKSAIFIKDIFNVEKSFIEINEKLTPNLNLLNMKFLNKSFRFDDNFAKLLDKHIYNNLGISGVEDSTTEISCIDCIPEITKEQLKRENLSECLMIVDKLKVLSKEYGLTENISVAILTPYINQLKLLKKIIQKSGIDKEFIDSLDILNTHKAQGREWDVVLFSTVDTAVIQGNYP